MKLTKEQLKAKIKQVKANTAIIKQKADEAERKAKEKKSNA